MCMTWCCSGGASITASESMLNVPPQSCVKRWSVLASCLACFCGTQKAPASRAKTALVEQSCGDCGGDRGSARDIFSGTRLVVAVVVAVVVVVVVVAVVVVVVAGGGVVGAAAARNGIVAANVGTSTITIPNMVIVMVLVDTANAAAAAAAAASLANRIKHYYHHRRRQHVTTDYDDCHHTWVGSYC